MNSPVSKKKKRYNATEQKSATSFGSVKETVILNACLDGEEDCSRLLL